MTHFNFEYNYEEEVPKAAYIFVLWTVKVFDWLLPPLYVYMCAYCFVFFLNSNYQLKGFFYHKQLTRGQWKYFKANNDVFTNNIISVNPSVNLSYCIISKYSKCAKIKKVPSRQSGLFVLKLQVM